MPEVYYVIAESWTQVQEWAYKNKHASNTFSHIHNKEQLMGLELNSDNHEILSWPADPEFKDIYITRINREPQE